MIFSKRYSVLHVIHQQIHFAFRGQSGWHRQDEIFWVPDHLPREVFSIVSTLGSLFWTLVLLVMLFYCFSVSWLETGRLHSAAGFVRYEVLVLHLIVVQRISPYVSLVFKDLLLFRNFNQARTLFMRFVNIHKPRMMAHESS